MKVQRFARYHKSMDGVRAEDGAWCLHDDVQERLNQADRAILNIERALRLAKEATNGWACYAKRQAEHDNIANLHREITEIERDATTTKGDGRT